ncbi:MAG: radical SAM protein [Candidatus Omnitrophota bacterium]|nr:radical SAM protein [Candidatus Omnitrophota bacterium]
MNKKYQLLKNILFSNFRRLEYPYKVTFAMTYKCNLRCKICKIWQKDHKQELSVDEIGLIFKNLKNLSWLDLTGGEISAREDLIDVVCAITKNSNRLAVFHISTNGQLPDRIYLLVRKLIKLGVIPIVNIGLDGPQKVNDELRGKDGAYDSSIETYRMLKSIPKGYYYISCTISNSNIDHLDELVSNLKNISLFSSSDLHFNIFHNSSHYYQNDNINEISNLKIERLKKYFLLCKRGNIIKAILGNLYLEGLFKYLKGNRFPVECQALNSTCFINPYGLVFPCGIYDNIIGNLKDCNYNINKLWNSGHSIKSREFINQKRCPGCWSPCEAYPAILGHLCVV